MSVNYGLTDEDLSYAKYKLAKQKDFLESNNFTSATGQVKTLLDVSYSANHSPRYFARILNKVHTFVSYNMQQGLTPLFLTTTLDGFFRDFLRGDYRRWTPETREKYLDHIPNDDRHGFLLDAIDAGETLTVKDLYKILIYQMFRFLRSHTLQQLKKDGFSYSYIRVTEPHKDGVPHFHMLFFIPEHLIPNLYADFQKFPAPQNHKPIKYRTPESIDSITETEGFKFAIESTAGYILKYILKSFRNVENDDELDYLNAWYTINKIPRIITSRTLVSQSIYHLTSMLDDDWFYLTHIKHSGGLFTITDKNYFHFVDIDGNREIIGDSGLYSLYNNKKLVKCFGSRVFIIPTIRPKSLKSFTTVKPSHFRLLDRFHLYKPLPPYKYMRDEVFYDGTTFQSNGVRPNHSNYKNGYEIETEHLSATADFTFLVQNDDSNLIKDYSIKSKRLRDLGDNALYQYYLSFDPDTENIKKYVSIQNELIYRGLLQKDLQRYEDYSYDFLEEILL